jgi:hypothetical protein
VRKWRPGSIETVEQEDFIKTYASLLWKRVEEGKPVGVTPRAGATPAKTAATSSGSASPRGGNSPVMAPKKSPKAPAKSPTSTSASTSAPILSLVDEETKDVVSSSNGSSQPALTDAERKKAVKESPKVLVLCGLPGSGKSTFGSLLESLNDDASLQANWTRVCQDDLRSRAACDAAVEKAVKNPMGRVIIDRCNDDSKVITVTHSLSMTVSVSGDDMLYVIYNNQ